MSPRLRASAGERRANDLAALGGRIEAALTAALGIGAEEVRAAALAAMPKRSGRLAASLFAEDEFPDLSVAVGTHLAHGRQLEFGTRRMAAKPWLRPALAQTRMTVIAHIRRALDDTIRRAQAGQS